MSTEVNHEDSGVQLPEICRTCEKFLQRTTQRGCRAYKSTNIAQQGTINGQCLGYTTNVNWEEELNAQVEKYAKRKQELNAR